MAANLTEVGEFEASLNTLLGTTFPSLKIYQSDGLKAHLIKRKHFDCLKHLSDVPDIIANPDYVGVSPTEPDSLEYIKVYDKNIMIGVKLDTSGDYLYVASMYSVQESKVQRRLHSGRLKRP